MLKMFQEKGNKKYFEQIAKAIEVNNLVISFLVCDSVRSRPIFIVKIDNGRVVF